MDIVSIDETYFINDSVINGLDIYAPSFTNISDVTQLDVY